MQTVKRTGSRKTLTAANLVALGGEHLAAILMDAAEDDPSLKRRLRLELAGAAGPEHLVNEISKRLVALEGRRSRRRVERAADAERQIEELAALSARIETWGEVESHAAFMARMVQISRF